MIKDVFELKKDNIFCKMLKYSWNVNYDDFSHMCPFFWLSIITVIILPVIVFIKIEIFLFVNIVKVLFKLIEWIAKIDSKYTEKVHKRTIERIKSDPEYVKKLIKKWKYSSYNIPGYIKHADVDNDINKIMSGEYKKYSEQKKKKELTNKEKINLIVKYALPIGRVILYIIGIIIIILGLYIIYTFIDFLIHFHYRPIDWEIVLKVLKYIGVSISLLAAIALIVFILRFLFNMVDLYIPNINIFKPFKWLWKGLCTIVQMIIQLYHNSCPAIKWKD